ncbi:MAG: type VII secretion target [Rhodococcus sp. (in: high G+C Gram-positive bacteria)]
MTEVTATATAIEAYAGTTAAMSTQVAGAAAAESLCGPAVLAPVFGVVGTEFLAAFTAVHVNRLDAVVRLAGAMAHIGGAAGSSSLAYDLTDAETAASLL